MRPEMSIEYIRKYPSECLPDFHVGVIDHLAITVPHAQVWAHIAIVNLSVGVHVHGGEGAEREFPRSVHFHEG